jgi:cytochrome c5
MERARLRACRGERLKWTAGLLSASAALLTWELVAQELPAELGRHVMAKRCLSCHEADLITQQRLTRAAWMRSVEKMVRWGAVLDADERGSLLDYLAARFAYEPAFSHIVTTATGEEVYKRACLTCHEGDVIETQRLSRAAWVRTVEKMVRWGATVPAEDMDGLLDYLGTHYRPR